jgi:hypothetical protein
MLSVSSVGTIDGSVALQILYVTEGVNMARKKNIIIEGVK